MLNPLLNYMSIVEKLFKDNVIKTVALGDTKTETINSCCWHHLGQTQFVVPVCKLTQSIALFSI